ncbi:MAG: hypothetical protein FJ122_10495 [Deltaproteobacteria bacterium]|nr:hypothetical protein [Deltaproteobacteria bacterium]
MVINVRLNNDEPVRERLSEIITEARQLCNALLVAPQKDVDRIDAESVPVVRGIYCWSFKGDGLPAYIGVALGKHGLRGRISQQHLRPSYVQSVFRKSVMREAGVWEREESVKLIRSRFKIAFVEYDKNPGIVRAAEALLIAALEPKYNKMGKKL